MKEKDTYSGCIYFYENKINNNVYIGQSSNPKLRYAKHKSKTSISTRIDKAINDFGIENFDYKILVWIERDTYQEYKDDIDELETFYMNKYRNLGYTLYNSTEKGGGNTWANYNSKREYGPLSEEQKKKISDSLNKYYKTHKGRDHSGDKNPSAKKVIGINVETEEIVEIYSCGKYACDKIGMKYSTFKNKIKSGIMVDGILYIYDENNSKKTL